MNISFIINTPAQVHFLKGIIQDLNSKDHNIYPVARDHDDTIELLEEMNFEYFINSGFVDTKMGRILSLPKLVFGAYDYLNNLELDLIFGFGNYTAYISTLQNIPSIIFRNSPAQNFQTTFKVKLLKPFLDTIISPKSSTENLGDKQIKVNSFIEMNYLTTEYFTPDPKIFDILGISEEEDFALIRFNSFEAIHDIGKKSFDREKKIQLVDELNKYIKIFISAESDLPERLEKHRLQAPKHRIHDILYYSKLLVTDTQTMTTESAILGTPVIRSNSYVGENDMGNFIDLEENYGMIYNIKNANKATEKALELIKQDNLKEEWKEKRKKLIDDKIDMRKFMVWFLENYPESFEKMKNNPDIQYRFE